MITEWKALLNKSVAEYRGHLFYVYNDPADRTNKDRRLLRSMPGDDVSDLSGFTPEPGVSTSTAVVHRADLDAMYGDAMFFRWRGKPFSVIRIIDDDDLEGYFEGGDSGWAKKNGLSGDQYSGFTRKFKTGEVDDLHIERKDFLTGRTERREP